jgi:hypothetical protein
MTEVYEKNLVILGLDFPDAHAEYVRLASEEPFRVVHTNVLVRYPWSLRSIEGLRVHDFVTTERSTQHHNYEEAVALLRDSHMKTGDK